MKQTLLVIGSGGREHALVWKLAQSEQAGKIFIAPGNGGTAEVGENVTIPATDIPELVRFATEKQVDLTVVGPDDPLAAGVVDAFKAAGLRVFGPTKAAAEIEASKAFSKDLMKGAGIPTAAYAVFADAAAALAYCKEQTYPLVVKASGLALGKGVFICQTAHEAAAAVHSIMTERVFGTAGAEVVIEEYLEGPEVSIHALSDGTTFRLFPSAQDHKPIGEGDRGPNTGGMGTIAPVPGVTAAQMSAIGTQIVAPTLVALQADRRAFAGLLYPGLKLTADGPRVLEFNARFGDPETQSYLRLLKSDLVEVLGACADGRLDQVELEWAPGYAVCIVLASGGYPGEYAKGVPIRGIEAAGQSEDVEVFHAGTKWADGELQTAGGRVLNVTATGEMLPTALAAAYAAVGHISFDGMQYRRDIGQPAMGGRGTTGLVQ